MSWGKHHICEELKVAYHLFHGFMDRTTATIALSPPFIPVTPFEQKVSDYMVEAWTNFVKGASVDDVRKASCR